MNKPMDIFKTLVGDKVLYTFPMNGYKSDQEFAAARLKFGDAYTVKRIDVRKWHTDVTFEEVEGRFNSVLFENMIQKEERDDERQ